jgi:hypothetical protein
MTIAAAAASAAVAAGASAGVAGGVGALASTALGAGISRAVDGSPTNNAIKGQGGGGSSMGGDIMSGIQEYVKNTDMSQPEAAPADPQPNFARNPIPAPNNGQSASQQPTQNFTPITGNQFSPVAQTPSPNFGRPQGQGQSQLPDSIQGFISHLMGGLNG